MRGVGVRAFGFFFSLRDFGHLPEIAYKCLLFFRFRIFFLLLKKDL